jgi:RNA polymerase sigma-70 factor (ECF subfamily)
LVNTDAQTEQAAATDRRSKTVARAVERAKAGDRDAIRFLYARYADNVHGYVRSILRNEHEAEDVTQQVFAKLITSIHKYEPRQVPFSAWILRVAHNLAIDDMRRRRAVPVAEVRPVDEAHDGVDLDQARALKDALAGLPTEQREVLVLRHVVGLSPGEIGARMGRSEASIHGLHHRGRGALQARLRELGCAPVTAA